MSKKQVKFLRSMCHDLKPVVTLGQKGLSDAVLNELEITLDHHELVKVKLSLDDRELRKELIEKICEHSGAEVVQTIGKTVSVFRRNHEKPVISLPNA